MKIILRYADGDWNLGVDVTAQVAIINAIGSTKIYTDPIIFATSQFAMNFSVILALITGRNSRSISPVHLKLISKIK